MRKTLGIVAAALVAGVLSGEWLEPTSRRATRSTRGNVDKVKDLVSPGMYWCVKHGFPITIVETKRIEWPKAYKEATEKYARAGEALGRRPRHAELRRRAAVPEGRSEGSAARLQDHVELRTTVRSTTTTSTSATSTPTPARSPQDGPLQVERHFLVDHFRRLFWTGRLYVDPKPEMPNPKAPRSAEPLPADRAVRSEGRRRALLPLLRSGEAGRHLALPAVAPPRAPSLDRAALRRALRSGHRRRQLRRVRRPDRLDGLEVPRREARSSAPCTPRTSP